MSVVFIVLNISAKVKYKMYREPETTRRKGAGSEHTHAPAPRLSSWRFLVRGTKLYRKAARYYISFSEQNRILKLNKEA